MGKVSSEPIAFDASFQGPVGKRSCRDVFWLLLFVLFLVGWGVLGWQALITGNPKEILYPVDSQGHACGFNNAATGGGDLTSKPYLYFINPLDSDGGQVCVAACPTETKVTVAVADVICMDGVVPTLPTLLTLQDAGSCTTFIYESHPSVSRCVPSDVDALLSVANSDATSTYIQAAIDGKETAMLIIGDFARTWMWFLAFAGIALVVSFVWLVLMRYFTSFVVWLTTFLGLLAIDGFAVFFYFAWQDTVTANTADGVEVTDQMKTEEYTYLGLFAGITTVAVLANLVILFLRKRIKVAVQIVKESVSAVRAMPLILFFPVFTFILMLGALAYWIVVALYIASSSTNPAAFGYSYELTILKYLQWYNLFGLFWIHQFLSGLNQMTIAGAVATWYWARDKRALPKSPVIKSLGRTLRYHLGTLALGALVIAVVQIIRVVLFQAQRQLRGSQNKAAKGVLACCQCCFACVEKIMKFINKNAYIQSAIHGQSFCKSSKNAFQLLLRNAFRLLAIDSVAGFVLFLGRLFVSSLCGCGSYYWFKYYYAANPLGYQSASVIVIMIIGYAISGVFFYVVDMAIDTIFLSFCEDCERNDGSEDRPYYMSERLMQLANVKNLGSKKAGKPAMIAATSTVSTGGSPVANKKATGKVVKGREAFVSEM